MSNSTAHWRNERNRRIRAKIFATEDPSVIVVKLGSKNTVTVSLNSDKKHRLQEV